MGVGHEPCGASRTGLDQQWAGGDDRGGAGDESEPGGIFRSGGDERCAAGQHRGDGVVSGDGVRERDGAGTGDRASSSGRWVGERADVVDVADSFAVSGWRVGGTESSELDELRRAGREPVEGVLRGTGDDERCWSGEWSGYGVYSAERGGVESAGGRDERRRKRGGDGHGGVDLGVGYVYFGSGWGRAGAITAGGANDGRGVRKRDEGILCGSVSGQCGETQQR